MQSQMPFLFFNIILDIRAHYSVLVYKKQFSNSVFSSMISMYVPYVATWENLVVGKLANRKSFANFHPPIIETGTR